jgi:hypothetical protein
MLLVTRQHLGEGTFAEDGDKTRLTVQWVPTAARLISP